MTDKVKMVCKTCGSDRVLRDAYAEWDVNLQEWCIKITFDGAFCESCEGECKIKEKPLSN